MRDLGVQHIVNLGLHTHEKALPDTQLGHGTTIRIFLPALVPERVDTGGTAGTVLITEDDPDVLTIAAETLRLFGYEVHTATNATEALAILNEGQPIDILFTDMIMPHGMNGIALAREARRLRPEIRVLLASGYSRERANADEEMAFLAKPYQMAELARQIEALRQR